MEKCFLCGFESGSNYGRCSSLTVAHTLTVITYHVLQDKKILVKLQEELRSVMPNVESKAKWNQLEQLPYLVSLSMKQQDLGHSCGSLTRTCCLADRDHS